MAITFYKLLAPVIEKDIKFAAQQLGISVSDVYQMILAEAARNQQEWFSNGVPNLNYQCQDCRLAYLYIVASSNANTFKHVLETNADLNTYVMNLARNNKNIKICALGGGPGTELLAMTKFFHEQRLGYCVSVDFQLLDKVQEWANSWYGIRNTINCTLQSIYGVDRNGWPILPSGNFITCDVTNPGSLMNTGNIWGQDVYVINFLLSEVFNDDPGVRIFIKEIASMAPVGSRFVFIERKGSMWASRIQKIAAEANLILSNFYESQLNKDYDEFPEDLGNVFLALSQTRKPRLTWNIIYSIGIKQ
ncbi:hypothetical protein [Desulfonatronum thiodismutans]|uniref:hypothetical protein n=1 Tax=Desulfonatronum thiodismutans TaxID=159290 RepID=UPI0012681FF0|nr:hypothetical protein [Desulfonatronum thiodismutans]